MITASIFDIQKFSLHDGPGIRTTVFFRGCNLRCQWCHNPEGIESTSPGRIIKMDELLYEVESDKEFFKSSGGGVTLSGGECMLQADFLCEFARLCQMNGIHVAIDTAGNVAYSEFEKVLPYTDLFLYDIKMISDDKHLEFTGVSNQIILENLTKLVKSGKSIWIRIPLIPEVNANEDELKLTAALLGEIDFDGRIDIMGYHTFGRNKYINLYGKEPQIFQKPDESNFRSVQKIFGKFKNSLQITV